MRISALAGLFTCAVIIAANSSTAKAETLDIIETNKVQTASLSVSALTAINAMDEEKPEVGIADRVASVPQSKIHEVAVNESLSSIAQQNQTTWKRIFDKNEQIINPDIIKVGDSITIPLPDEVLVERALPEPPVQVVSEAVSVPSAPVERQVSRTVPDSGPSAPAPRKQSTPAADVNRGGAPGNTYSPGYCTWYVANMRSVPNDLGNADTWVQRAAAKGMATGSEPRVGAIGQQGMHVVYVQSVNDDGTVTISEMNYKGLYVISTRTVPAGSFKYIY